MKEVQTKMFDDLIAHQSAGEDKVEATETLEFEVDGERFSIDLTDDNAAAFREAVQPFKDAATVMPKRAKQRKPPTAGAPVGGSAKKTGVAKPSSKTAEERENQEIREWAAKNGFDLSTRGRLPQEVKDAYAAARHGVENGSVTHDALTDDAPTGFVPEPDVAEDTQDAERETV